MSRELRRLGDEAAPSSPEAEAGRLLRRARELPVPGPDALAQVLARVERRTTAPSVAPRWRPSLAACALLVAGGALAAGVGAVWPRGQDAAADAGPDLGRASLPAPVVREPAPVPVPDAGVPEDLAAPSDAGSPVGRPPPRSPRRAPGFDAGLDAGALKDAAQAPPPEPAPDASLAPDAAEPTAPRSTDLAEECRLLDEALRLIEHQQPGQALAPLEEHRRRFPAGEMRDEVLAARVSALVALERRAEALAVLEALPPASTRARGLQALRGELLAHAGRCPEAEALFEPLLGGTDEAAQRSLFGRASCRAREGDFAGSERDLASYLRRFPKGRFAGEARQAMQRQR